MIERSSHLAALLREFPSALDPGGFVQRMSELLSNTTAPFSGAQYQPGHFTASAFILSPDGDSLLLIHHKKLGLWLQPGGHVESTDPDVLSAARREVREEVGIEAASLATPGLFDIDIHRIPSFKGLPPHEHFDLRFLFRAPTLDHQASSEVRAARWVKLSELSTVDTDESVRRAARRLS